MSAMRGITVKLPEATIRRLQQEALATGRSVGQLIRDLVERESLEGAASVHAMAADLAGSVAGSGRSATNDRVRFRRS
jgi:hypothetical protein